MKAGIEIDGGTRMDGISPAVLLMLLDVAPRVRFNKDQPPEGVVRFADDAGDLLVVRESGVYMPDGTVATPEEVANAILRWGKALVDDLMDLKAMGTK